jgi:uncharacterized membrane protein YhhN
MALGIGLNLTAIDTGAGIIKALPVLLLTAGAWAYTRTRFWYWIVSAAFFGAVGDFCLASAEREWLLPGLVAFLVGHVAYCIAFAKDLQGSRARSVVIAVTLLFTMALLAAVCLRFVRAAEYGLIAPVSVYVAIMGVMMAIAVLHRSTTHLIAAGGVVFILSDAHIALNHMLLEAPQLPITLSGYTTYYLAQGLLVAGAIHEARHRP